jgi:hypothetical protein
MKRKHHFIPYYLIILSLIPSLLLAACATSIPQTDNLNSSQNVPYLDNNPVNGEASKSKVEKNNKNNQLFILRSCRRSLSENSEVAFIRKQIQKDLQDAGLGEKEIENQLNLYDLRTCDLR